MFFVDMDVVGVMAAYAAITHAATSGRAVSQLVEALRYKPEGRRFDFLWCQWNFSST